MRSACAALESAVAAEVCTFASEERNETRAAPALVATLVDFNFVRVGRTAWRVKDGAGLCHAAVDARLVVEGLLLGESRSIGTRTAVTQANGFGLVHDDSRGGRWLQPARAAASTQRRSVLKHASQIY